MALAKGSGAGNAGEAMGKGIAEVWGGDSGSGEPPSFLPWDRSSIAPRRDE